MTPEEKRAAQAALGQAYAEYMSESVGVRARLKEEFRLQLERAIDDQLGHIKAKMGRAIARNPLPVREKQRITASTNWYRYRDFLDAAGEVDVSSRQGRLEQKLDSLKNEIDQNTDSQKLDSDKNPVQVTEVTDKMLAWEHYDGALRDHTLGISDEDVWFEVLTVEGGPSRVWAMNAERERPLLVFEFAAGDDEWSTPTRAYDRGETSWDGEREAVVKGFEDRE